MNLKLSSKGSFTYIFTFLAVLALLSVFIPSYTVSQSFVTGQDINIEQSSDFPKPNSSLSLEASSNSFDINKAEVSWYVNGSLVETARGGDSFSVNIGASGSETNVAIVVTTDKGATIRRDMVFRPASVDLVYESLTSQTHPFYQGKKITTHLSPTKVVAFANFVDTNGKVYGPDEIIYKWSINGNISAADSGLGRNQIIFSGPTYHKSAGVRVDAETVDGKFLQARQITIKAEDPKIIFYEEHPTLGIILDKAYFGNTFNLIEEEVTLRAIPFGMNDLDNFRDVEYLSLIHI